MIPKARAFVRAGFDEPDEVRKLGSERLAVGSSGGKERAVQGKSLSDFSL